MRRLIAESNLNAKQAIAEDGGWLTGVTGIVAENKDPEKQHRVKVIIPSIDEDIVYDEWARQMVFCLGNGYGSAFIPPKGSEVVLFGQLGQKYNLFYASLYNEEMMMPDGYPDEQTVGVKAPGNLIFVAELLAKIQAQNIEIIAAQLAKMSGENIQVMAGQLAKTSGENIESAAGQLNKVSGNEIQLNASTVKINGNGTIEITGGAVKITGSSIKLFNRTVNQTGPAI